MIEVREKLFNLVTKYFYLFILIYFSFAILFARSGVGIYFGPLRLGEIAIASSFVFFVLYLFSAEEDEDFKIIKLLMSLLFISFLIILFIFKNNILEPYTFRASSYIWTVSLLILGANIKKLKLKNKVNNYIYLFFLFVYFLGIFNFPSGVLNFITSISDKIEFHKGSDLLMLFVLFFFIYNKQKNITYRNFQIFIFFSSLYLPFFLYKSRASFIACFAFFLFESFKYLRKIKLKRWDVFLLIIIVLFVATFSTFVSQKYLVPDFERFPEEIKKAYSDLISYRLELLNTELPILIFHEGRLYSGDGNLNWRIQMWQDMVLVFNQDKTLYITGVGYGEKLPVFNIDIFSDAKYRTGLDGLNEHLHNYLLTVFSRGGIFHLLLAIALYFFIIKIYYKRNKDLSILVVLLPIIFVSSFDSSMENAHFSLLFYFFIGNQLINKK